MAKSSGHNSIEQVAHTPAEEYVLLQLAFIEKRRELFQRLGLLKLLLIPYIWVVQSFDIWNKRLMQGFIEYLRHPENFGVNFLIKFYYDKILSKQGNKVFNFFLRKLLVLEPFFSLFFIILFNSLLLLMLFAILIYFATKQSIKNGG